VPKGQKCFMNGPAPSRPPYQQWCQAAQRPGHGPAKLNLDRKYQRLARQGYQGQIVTTPPPPAATAQAQVGSWCSAKPLRWSAPDLLPTITVLFKRSHRHFAGAAAPGEPRQHAALNTIKAEDPIWILSPHETIYPTLRLCRAPARPTSDSFSGWSVGWYDVQAPGPHKGY
jgi:hypothetical protein